MKAFGQEFRIDLGENHWLRWNDEGYVGGSILHIRPDGTECVMGFNLLPGGWTIERVDPLTITPSLLCSCGDHGFIREGKWIRA